MLKELLGKECSEGECVCDGLGQKTGRNRSGGKDLGVESCYHEFIMRHSNCQPTSALLIKKKVLYLVDIS